MGLADPFTCRHNVGDVEYHLKGAKCRACGREWFKWTNPKGHEMYLTEPKYPKKGQSH